MPQRDDSKVALSPAEWDIMKIFWDHGPLAARDVFSKLPDDRGWAPKTVKTLLSRLVAKEALAFSQIGNSYLYRAVIDREEMTRSEVRSVFHRLMSEACSPVLATFIEEANLSDADIKQLKRLLDEKRKNAQRS